MTPPWPHRHAPPARQGGAALLTAMVIVTLVATLAAGMVWQQWRAVQVEAAERAQSQAQWILNGALDWARLILREDARSGGADHLGEPWAVPLAEARLSTFLAADRDRNDDAPDAFLSGVMRDAQARYNLRNLIVQGKVDPTELASLQTLASMVGAAPDLAARLADQLQLAEPFAASSASPGGTATPGAGSPPPPTRQTPATGGSDNQRAPLMPPSVAQLNWLGVDAASLAALLPHIVLLPRATPINLNTAGPEVMAAVLGVSLGNAQCLVQLRQRTPLKTLQEAEACVPAAKLNPPSGGQSTRISTASNFFEVTGSLRLEELQVSQRSLVEKLGPPTLTVRVLSTERIRRPEDVASSLQQ